MSKKKSALVLYSFFTFFFFFFLSKHFFFSCSPHYSQFRMRRAIEHLSKASVRAYGRVEGVPSLPVPALKDTVARYEELASVVIDLPEDEKVREKQTTLFST